MIRAYLTWKARRKLAADKRKRMNSYRVQDFSKRRKAALKRDVRVKVLG